MRGADQGEEQDMNGPFAIKIKIDNCFRLAKECGFDLREVGNRHVAGEE